MITELPQKILIENKIENHIDEFLKRMELGNSCTIVTDQTVLDVFADKLLKKISIKTDVVKPESLEQKYLYGLAKKLAATDFFVGIGGGRVIDSTKFIAKTLEKEWISIPTILSHDGIVSSRATLDDNGMRISITTKGPRAIAADLAILKKAPYRYAAAGAGDIISNFSAVNDWKLAAKAKKENYNQMIGELAFATAKSIIESVKEIKKTTEKGIETLLWGLIYSGIAMNSYGSSRPCSGSEHNISHALDKLKAGGLHGEQCALATIVTLYLQGDVWEDIKKVLKKLGLPTTAKEANISAENMIKALAMAKDIRNRYTILNEVNINEEKAEEILKEVGII